MSFFSASEVSLFLPALLRGLGMEVMIVLTSGLSQGGIIHQRRRFLSFLGKSY